MLDSPPHVSRVLGDRVLFLDRDGCSWTAREVDGSRVPGGRGAHCLILESLRAVHRVWQYPSAWRALPPEGLVALLAAR